MTRGPIVSEATLLAYTRPNIDSLHTLTGVSLESFCIMHRIASLYRQKRSVVTDEALADLMGASTRVEKDLEREKQRLDMSVRGEFMSPVRSSLLFLSQTTPLVPSILSRSVQNRLPPSASGVRARQHAFLTERQVPGQTRIVASRGDGRSRSSRILLGPLGYIHHCRLCDTWRIEPRRA